MVHTKKDSLGFLAACEVVQQRQKQTTKKNNGGRSNATITWLD
jgi:hypothetical protein